uniref:DNA-3-methyladenine glycosylase I n=1 Tax=Desulfatirhabdium butyrativorans TaxID=340467 RepID=A0A7C4RI24_9BACT
MKTSSSILRCPWVDLTKPDYIHYHDTEWGVPVHDDRKLFEFLILESAQAGLSWYTILRRRRHYREAFADWDPQQVARFTHLDIERLMNDPGIIRNRKKIEAAVRNARAFLDVQEAFGSFDAYVWRFVDGRPIVNALYTRADYPVTSIEAKVMSRDMRQRGFVFFGPIICYAHMQATGMVLDHTMDCFRREEILRMLTDD